MRSAIVLAILATVALTSCQTTAPLSGETPGSDGVTFSGGDGHSEETAIIVNARNDAAGTDAIYGWLREHCKCRLTGQSLITGRGRTFDLMDGERTDGSKVSYYFDITESFGKW